jgi:regulator of replication initiation timing
MYKKKTLRHMQPLTRRYARIVNDLDGVLRRLRNLKDEIARLELDSSALYNQRIHEIVLAQATVPDQHPSNEDELSSRIDAAEILYEKGIPTHIETPQEDADE